MSQGPAPTTPEDLIGGIGTADGGATGRELLRGGQAWSRRLRRHQRLRMIDVDGGACVAALFYNARDPLERYNMPDTLKAQFTAFLTAGRVLYSDLGRILCSIVADDVGWHDTITGLGHAADGQARFGAGTYQTLRNGFHRNARDNLLVELGKHGLGKRDVVANVNFFTRVIVGDDGGLAHVPWNSRPGAAVELRFEMDTLVVLSSTPHPLDRAPEYRPGAIELVVSDGPPAGPDDPCRLSRPENGRGFALTAAYAAEMEGTP
jgi:urea carboxylase-associated protein 2